MPVLKSWTSPKTQRGLSSPIHGLGFFAKEPIKKDEIVAIKGGHIIGRQELLENLSAAHGSQLQITEDMYIAPLSQEEVEASMVCCNHSCEPSAGWSGQIVFLAMRDIAAGEEITCDYAMHFDDDIMQFDCNCQTPSCRKRVTGRDWQIPELQAKYKGYFAWFLEQKIKALGS